MKKTIATLLVALLASLQVCQASAADALKIGYVNTPRLFTDAPAAERARKKLEQEFHQRDLDLQRLAKQVQGLKESLEKTGLTMPEADRRAKEKDLADLSREFQRKQREFREDLNLRQNDENAAIIEKANKAIKQIAENEKYDLIIQEAVWANPKLDITDKILKALSDPKDAK